MKNKYDFSGWATKNNIKCSDGRTILKDAFKDNDGQKVPLVWNHQHNSTDNVLGHAILENRENGVYAYCTFNNTDAGKQAKELVNNGDVSQLSIYANKLKSNMGDVIHGCIREVSLVLAGANPGAVIDTVLTHSDSTEEANIFYDDEDNIEVVEHSESEEPILESENDSKESEKVEEEEQTKMKENEINKTIEHSDEKEKTVGDVYDSLTDEQKSVVNAIVAQAVEQEKTKNNKDDESEEKEMKHNVFEQDKENDNEVLMHSEEIIADAIADGKRFGSLKESFLEHAGANNIDNIDYLFPDAKELNNPPKWIKENDEWVNVIMNGISRTPFSRVKTSFATMDENTARAKGYIKGNRKKDIQLSILKRVTTPTTVYIKNKIDRDDVIDITSFDVIAWEKAAMKKQLDKEIALAILLGDGRVVSDEDKINEQNIRPIISDDEMFTITYTITDKVDYDSTKENDSYEKGIVRAAVRSRKDYKGSGKPTFFTTEDTLTSMLLIEDLNGRRIYETEAALATALRCKNIVTVPEMEGEAYKDIVGVFINPNDYTAGADKGGKVGFFDDFDIDYNQQKYLMETRMSGALTTPYSAIVLKAGARG